MDQGFIKKILYEYMTEKMMELASALEDANFSEIKEVGHKIKGNSGSLALGLTRINELGRVIEQNGLNNELSLCQAAYDELLPLVASIKVS